MITCPHCHKAIEINPRADVSFWRRNMTPGLGTGSLVAIALIVVFCSGGYGSQRTISGLETEVQKLSQKVDELQSSMALLTASKPASKTATP